MKSRVCPSCYKKHQGKFSFCSQCARKYNEIQRKLNPDAAERKRFLDRKTWNMVRNRILARDDFTCRIHLFIGQVLKRPDNPVDHFTPRQTNESWWYNDENLWTLCSSCHNRKSRFEELGFRPNWLPNQRKYVFSNVSQAVKNRLREKLLPSDVITEHLTKVMPEGRLIMLRDSMKDGFELASTQEALWFDFGGIEL